MPKIGTSNPALERRELHWIDPEFELEISRKKFKNKQKIKNQGRNHIPRFEPKNKH